MSGSRKTRSKRLAAEQVFAAFTPLVENAGCDQFGIVTDVSATGLGIRSPASVPISTPVRASVSIAEQCFQIELVVRRVEDLGGGERLLGLSFTGEQSARNAFLRAYLANQQAPAER